MNTPWTGFAVASLGSAVFFLAGIASGQNYCSVERADVATGGGEGNIGGEACDVDASGRYIAFHSLSDNLAAGDTNNARDIFLRDRVAGTTQRISVSSTGAQALGTSDFPSISGDGRYIAFLSDAANLVIGDTNGTVNVFVRDRLLSTTARESLGPGGTQIHGDCLSAELSADGSTLCFNTLATDLGQVDVNGTWDPYARNRVTGVVELIAPALGGGTSDMGGITPRLSADGRFAVFSSSSSNLVAGKTAVIEDIFVRDRLLSTTTWISSSLSGGQGSDGSFEPAISDDGRYVGFETYATDVLPGPMPIAVQVGRRDRVSGAIYNVSTAMGGAAPDNGCYGAEISADGRFVAFIGIATNLVPVPSNGAGHVYVRDCVANTTERRSLKANGGTVGFSGSPLFHALTPDASILVWSDMASDVVPDDQNGWPDVFVRDCSRNYSLLCAAKLNSQGCWPALSASGSTSASSAAPFTLTSTQLINQKLGLYIYSLACFAQPFQGGTLCPAVPIKRLTPMSTGGNPPPNDCSGTLVFDFKPVIQTTPALVAGTLVYLQGYYRDGASQPSLTGLTQGLELQVAP